MTFASRLTRSPLPYDLDRAQEMRAQFGDLPPELQAVLGYAMGSYALGYYTPPLPPGAGPEVVPPEYALGRSGDDSTMGDAELLAAITAEVAAN